MIDEEGRVDFNKIRFNSQNFREELPAFEEQVPNFDRLIYDPSVDPVMEAHANLNKGEFPEAYYVLRDRQEEDQDRANLLSRTSEWRHINKLFTQTPVRQDLIRRKSQYNQMVLLESLKSKSGPLCYVNLDPRRADELRRLVQQAKDP